MELYTVTGTAMSDKAPRQHWLGILARAPADFLEQHLAVLAQGSHQWLRPAETGLVMVRARAGGTGQRFNLGEATVTRCVIRPDAALTGTQQVGVGYVLGCSHRQALLVALADALLQQSELHAYWYDLLIAPLAQMQAQASAQQQAQTQSTRVEFFTVARETGSDRGDEDAP
jgi:alpha-D-ribose 1-methylphosphonate 5-triphosphate synthase subunit PhnG